MVTAHVYSLPMNDTNIESRIWLRIGERSSQPSRDRLITLDPFPPGMGSGLSQLVRLFLGLNISSTLAMLPHVNSLVPYLWSRNFASDQITNLTSEEV